MNLRYLLIILLLIPLLPQRAFADSIHSDAELDKAILTANDLFLNAEFDAGIAMIRSLEKTHPGNPAVSYFTANGYWWKLFRIYVYDKEGRNSDYENNFNYYLDQTIERCDLLLKRNRRDIRALFYLGNAYSLKSRLKGLYGSYFSAGRDAGKGKGHLEEVLRMEPNQYDAHYNLGVYNYLAGALPGYAKVLKIFLFLPGGTKEKGLSLLKIAGKKSSYFGPEAQLILARFYADFEDQPQEAASIVETFHAKYPSNAWFDYWRGTLYSDEINDYEKSHQIYSEILQKCDQRVPGYTIELKNQAWLKFGRVENRLLHPEKAIEQVKALLATKPTQPSWIAPRAYMELGSIMDQVGMRRDAVAAYTQVLSYRDYRNSHEQAKKLRSQEYNQTLADIYRLNLEGRRLASEGRYDDAKVAFEKVLDRYANNEQTLYYIAEMNISKGAHQEAMNQFQQLLRRAPKEPKWLVPGIYVRLGRIYEAIKQTEAAKGAYLKALESKTIFSDDRNAAKRALRQLSEKG